MAKGARLKGVKKHRRIGFHTKHNKKSVALRKQLRKQEVKNARRKDSNAFASGSLETKKDFIQQEDSKFVS